MCTSSRLHRTPCDAAQDDMADMTDMNDISNSSNLNGGNDICLFYIGMYIYIYTFIYIRIRFGSREYNFKYTIIAL